MQGIIINGNNKKPTFSFGEIVCNSHIVLIVVNSTNSERFSGIELFPKNTEMMRRESEYIKAGFVLFEGTIEIKNK